MPLSRLRFPRPGSKLMAGPDFGETMRLVLCDDNLLLGEALAPALTASGHQIAAITTSLAGGLAAIRAHRPDACLIGLRPPGEDGLAGIRAIRQRHPGTAVVILARAADPSIAWGARKLGVAGFLSKDANVAQIAQALAAVAAGGTVFEPGLTSRPPDRARRDRQVYELTPREQEVLRRIVDGQGTGQMAKEMNIAISTLRSYVKTLLTKLGTHSRLQAAALASREELIAEMSA
jgi:two-component system, NarL family, nitrate/nitrite response regulator NarL